MEILYYHGIIYLALWASCVMISVRAGLAVYHPTVVYLAYFLFGYVLRPFAVAIDGQSQLWMYIGILPTSNDFTWALVVNIACLLSFCIFPIIAYPDVFKDGAQRSHNFIIERPVNLGLAMVTLAALGIYGSFASYGGSLSSGESLESMVIVDAKGGQRLDDVSGYQTILGEFLPAILIFSYVIWGTNLLTVLCTLGFVVFKLWLASGGRKGILVVVLGLLLLDLARRGKRYPSYTFVAIFVPALLLFDFLGSNRSVLQSLFYGDVSVTQAWSNYIQTRGGQLLLNDVSEFDVSTLIYSVVPDNTGYNWGSQYLRLFVWPIPRQLWAEKPVYTSIIDLNSIGNFFGLTWSMHADYYSNFGLFSAVILMGLTGLLLASIHARVAARPSPIGLTFYWILILYLPVVYRDGFVSAVIYVAGTFVAALILIRAGSIKIVG